MFRVAGVSAVVRLVERLLAADRGQRLRSELSAVLGRLSPAPAPAQRDAADRTQLSRRTDDPDWFKGEPRRLGQVYVLIKDGKCTRLYNSCGLRILLPY